MDPRKTRPCSRCAHQAEHAAFHQALRALIAEHEATTRNLPEVVAECLSYTPVRTLPLKVPPTTASDISGASRSSLAAGSEIL